MPVLRLYSKKKVFLDFAAVPAPGAPALPPAPPLRPAPAAPWVLEVSFFSSSSVLRISKRTLFSSVVNLRLVIGRCCPSNGSFTIRVISAASLTGSNIGRFDPFNASTIYQFFPSRFSYVYQKRSLSFSQCGSTLVLNSILFTFVGENRAASAELACGVYWEKPARKKHKNNAKPERRR